ncbi:MAG: hypothetical protein AAB466_01815 [Verrucomicrobiota bacterium]
MKTICIHAGLLKHLRSLPATERKEIGARIAEAQRSVGQSHLHKGLGLRKLQDDYFEIRAGLKLRLVFDNTPSELVFEMLGDPDDVKKFLKSR